MLDGRADHEVSDVTICPRCATMLEYTSRWLSQLGDYRCPSCGFARPPRDLEARGVRTIEGHAEAQLAGVVAGKLRLRMPGLHNIYNALGTSALAQRLGAEPASALESLAAYQPVFGRWSLARRGDTAVQVNLVKNPAGMNQTLRALREVPGEKALVFVLNDNIADGRDISWIWDVDMEELLPGAGLVVTSGTRKHEMALRLSYAGVPDETLASVDSVAAALNLAAERHARSVYLLPTYTALKEVRGALGAGRWSASDRRPGSGGGGRGARGRPPLPDHDEHLRRPRQRGRPHAPRRAARPCRQLARARARRRAPGPLRPRFRRGRPGPRATRRRRRSRPLATLAGRP